MVLSEEPDAKLPSGNTANVLTALVCPVNVLVRSPSNGFTVVVVVAVGGGVEVEVVEEEEEVDPKRLERAWIFTSRSFNLTESSEVAWADAFFTSAISSLSFLFSASSEFVRSFTEAHCCRRFKIAELPRSRDCYRVAMVACFP